MKANARERYLRYLEDRGLLPKSEFEHEEPEFSLYDDDEDTAFEDEPAKEEAVTPEQFKSSFAQALRKAI